jgi:hypothetical protein
MREPVDAFADGRQQNLSRMGEDARQHDDCRVEEVDERRHRFSDEPSRTRQHFCAEGVAKLSALDHLVCRDLALPFDDFREIPAVTRPRFRQSLPR